MVTGLNSSISPDEFLGKLNKNNIMELDLRINILSFGFAQWGGFNTFSVSTRSNVGAYLPYELFEFDKLTEHRPNMTSIIYALIQATTLKSHLATAET